MLSLSKPTRALWGFLLLGLAACAQFQTPANLPPVTRVAALVTVTASPTQPTATPTTAPSRTPAPTQTLVVPSATPSPTPPPIVNFMAVGDLMLAGTVSDTLVAHGPGVVFAGVASVLAEADVLVGNLECAISERGAPEPKRYTFRAPPLAADALTDFDVLALANNHALDYGLEALADTQGLLAARKIATVGAGNNATAARAPVVLERNGLRLAFLAYVDVPIETVLKFDTRSWIATDATPGLAWADPDHITVDVQAARAQADVVIVLLHMGWESHAIIRAQRVAARAAIDAGAALVIGSHPHILQNVEEYNGGLILYSLGNFVFDNFGFPENYSAIFTATLTKDGVGEYTWVPVVVEEGLPRLATDEEAGEVLARVAPVP